MVFGYTCSNCVRKHSLNWTDSNSIQWAVFAWWKANQKLSKNNPPFLPWRHHVSTKVNIFLYFCYLELHTKNKHKYIDTDNNLKKLTQLNVIIHFCIMLVSDTRHIFNLKYGFYRHIWNQLNLASQNFEWMIVRITFSLLENICSNQTGSYREILATHILTLFFIG